ncbi:MAG: hypothetical protein ACI4WM_04450 [Erysipelotrichaceae bacterium]
MKKIVLIILLMFSLCGCKREGIIKGKVSGSDEKETFSIVDEEGIERSFGINENTVFISPDENIKINDILDGDYIVTVDYEKWLSSVYTAERITVDGFFEEYIKLRDENRIEKWRFKGYDAYYYEDTELLRIMDVKGPDGIYIIGYDGFESLSDEAKDKIIEYCHNLKFFDEQEELGSAYRYYMEDNENFNTFLCDVTIMSSAESEKYIYFSADALDPLDGVNAFNDHLCLAFDRESGELVNKLDLFELEEEELLNRLVTAMNIEGSELENVLREELNEDSIVFFKDNLEIFLFKENEYTIGIGYDKLDGILKKEAMPIKN